MMRGGEFNRRASATLERIPRALEESVPNGGCELKDGGVLETELTNGGRIIANRHLAAREIWVAANSGGYHFGRDGAHRINARDSSEFLPLCRGR